MLDLVEHGYRLHGGGHTVNPPSYFLRYPEDPGNRIIALPASVGGDVAVSGIKWISSFPRGFAGSPERADARRGTAHHRQRAAATMCTPPCTTC